MFLQILKLSHHHSIPPPAPSSDTTTTLSLAIATLPSRAIPEPVKTISVISCHHQTHQHNH
ncbi:hypothetical protein M6B38_160745 [Iris pallida]|uniref:Uncharacterized protein n=1 Tax=Iris pallida TaxID=29817 RepID=A0AAX6EZG6_IRIPA|nr:hypothetical protein M6B38_160745 [Iris pallida]